MPRRDGTGPMGQGALTGGGFGLCNNSDNRALGYGRGFGLGRGNNCRRNNMQPANSREFLGEQKKMLEDRLAAVNKQLNN